MSILQQQLTRIIADFNVTDEQVAYAFEAADASHSKSHAEWMDNLASFLYTDELENQALSIQTIEVYTCPHCGGDSLGATDSKWFDAWCVDCDADIVKETVSFTQEEWLNS